MVRLRSVFSREYITPNCYTLCWNPGSSVVSLFKPDMGPCPEPGVLARANQISLIFHTVHSVSCIRYSIFYVAYSNSYEWGASNFLRCPDAGDATVPQLEGRRYLHGTFQRVHVITPAYMTYFGLQVLCVYIYI